jgi:hypothetical protein
VFAVAIIYVNRFDGVRAGVERGAVQRLVIMAAEHWEETG